MIKMVLVQLGLLRHYRLYGTYISQYAVCGDVHWRIPKKLSGRQKFFAVFPHFPTSANYMNCQNCDDILWISNTMVDCYDRV